MSFLVDSISDALFWIFLNFQLMHCHWNSFIFQLFRTDHLIDFVSYCVLVNRFSSSQTDQVTVRVFSFGYLWPLVGFLASISLFNACSISYTFGPSFLGSPRFVSAFERGRRKLLARASTCRVPILLSNFYSMTHLCEFVSFLFIHLIPSSPDDYLPRTDPFSWFLVSSFSFEFQMHFIVFPTLCTLFYNLF